MYMKAVIVTGGHLGTQKTSGRRQEAWTDVLQGLLGLEVAIDQLKWLSVHNLTDELYTTL